MDIDFVVLWVDGNDPKWMKEKAKYQGVELNENNAVNRYRDWGLLKYWFRAVEQFAPWVRTVHFVTWGHIPAFLNKDCPKLNIVRHDEFIPMEYLPTFSSHTIELNIHRIPGLAEHFVYFNDDMFLLKDLSAESVFVDGMPCTYGGEIPIEFNGIIGTWQHAAVNDLGIINKHFLKRDAVKKNKSKYINKTYRWQDNIRTASLEKLYPDYFTGFKNLHAPAAYLKSTFEEVWDKEFEKLDKTCRNRFRTSDDVNQWVMLWWQIASGKFTPFVIDNYVNTVTKSSIEYYEHMIENQKMQYTCINDPDELDHFEELSLRLSKAFDSILPSASRFER